MPKSSLPFNSGEYALVASRISLFYERHPTGRIVTELVSRDRDVLFKASVYRSATDAQPSATGWASEREGDSEINAVACVENTETSAIGRALANLGFTASTRRPSREEIEKADRMRSAFYQNPGILGATARVSEEQRATNTQRADSAATSAPPKPASADRLADVNELLLEAAERGMPASIITQMHNRLGQENPTENELVGIERRIRHWVLQRRVPAAPDDPPNASTPPVNSPHQ